MGMKIRVDTIYEVWNITEVELPEGKTVDDINKIYMNSGTGHIEFKDGTTLEEDFEENYGEDGHYFKRPEKLTFAEWGTDYDEFGGD